MNNSRGLFNALVICAAAAMLGTPAAWAEDCMLDTDNNGTADGTGGASSGGNNTRLACGNSATAVGDASVAVGDSANAAALNATAVGANSASGTGSTALGQNASAGHLSTAIGAGTASAGNNSVSVGNYAVTSLGSEHAIALGYSAIADAVGAIVIGANLTNDVANSMLVGVPMRVSSANGDAGILVSETNAMAAPRTLFEISNPGNTKFSVTNTQAGQSWSFANPGTGFRLSRQGSGVVEFEVLNNGNAVLAGALTQNSDVNAKQDIESIDQEVILGKVLALPISEWSYRDAPGSRHIGPMAQDFHAAFGLGDTDKGIATLDTGGVALAAIQGMKLENDREIESLRASHKAQEERIARQQEEIDQLKSMLVDLMERASTEAQVALAR